MSVPLRTEFIATLRTVAASIGADAGFSIDEIDDLRLAISEVVSSLAESGDGSDDRVETVFEVGAARVAVTITTQHGERDIELDDLAASILNSVVDEFRVDGSVVVLVKTASEAEGAAGSSDESAPSRA